MKSTVICPTCGVKFTRIHTKDRTPKYCSIACRNFDPEFQDKASEGRVGTYKHESDHPNYKGGWVQAGYNNHRHFVMLVPRAERAEHPTVNSKGYMPRYHYVWNLAHPDDKVQPGEVVHHINQDSMDDRIENLEKFSGHSEHNHLHGVEIARGRARNQYGQFV